MYIIKSAGNSVGRDKVAQSRYRCTCVVYIPIREYRGVENKDEKPEKLFTCLTIIIEAPHTA